MEKEASEKLSNLTASQKELLAFAKIEPQDDVNWNVVQMIVEGYAEQYPEDIVGCIEAIKIEKNNLKDKTYAETGSDSGMRSLMKLPRRLEIGLQTQYPLIFTNKQNLMHFLNLYHIFKIPEKL